jgi:hypothetical protein
MQGMPRVRHIRVSYGSNPSRPITGNLSQARTFDLTSGRTVIVPRDDQSGLLREEFQSAPRAAINSSLGAL